tara:strand:- start:291 stop:1610 length:1320 start_codon:yes stop_codon:yes gene_type:complete
MKTLLLTILLSPLLIISQSTNTSVDLNKEVSYDIAISEPFNYYTGNYALIANGTEGLSIYDISNANTGVNPTFVSQILDIDTSIADGCATELDMGYCYDPIYGEVAYKVKVDGQYAYVAIGYSGLAIIDISDISNPNVVKIVDTDGQAFGVDISGDYAYVADDTNYIEIIDISTPSSASVVAGFTALQGYSSKYSYDIQIVGDYAYVASYRAGLNILDISSPLSPTVVGQVDGSTNSHYARDVFVMGDLAFINQQAGGFKVIDISDKENPTIVAAFDNGTMSLRKGFAGDQSGNYLFAADQVTNKIALYDVSNPSSPLQMETFNIGTDAHGMEYYEGLLHVVAQDGKYRTINPSTLGFVDLELNDIVIYSLSRDNLRILNLNSGQANLQMFDLMGKLVLNTSFDCQNVNDVKLPNLDLGVYIVNIKSDAGIVNKKLIIQ